MYLSVDCRIQLTGKVIHLTNRIDWPNIGVIKRNKHSIGQMIKSLFQTINYLILIDTLFEKKHAYLLN